MSDQEIPEVKEHQKPQINALLSVWQSPAWIAAMAGLVGVVFTIPQIAVSYLQTSAEIKRQEIITRGIFIDKAMTSNIEDRLVVLRWIEANGVKEGDQNWAKEEINKINLVLNKEAERNELLASIATLKKSSTDNQAKIEELSRDLLEKSRQLAVARAQVSAGSRSDDLEKKIAQLESENEDLQSQNADYGYFYPRLMSYAKWLCSPDLEIGPIGGYGAEEAKQVATEIISNERYKHLLCNYEYIHDF